MSALLGLLAATATTSSGDFDRGGGWRGVAKCVTGTPQNGRDAACWWAPWRGTACVLAAMLDEDEGVMLGEHEQVLIEGLRSGLVATLSRW